MSQGGLLFITARLWGAQYLLTTGAFNATPRLNSGNTGVFSVNIDCVVPVVPGDTTVELVARVRPQTLTSNRFQVAVASRALILWEITN